MSQPSLLASLIPGHQKSAASREELIALGSCCGNRCRSCPYDPRHVKGSTKIKPREEDAPKEDEALENLGPQPLDNTAPQPMKAAGVAGSQLLLGALLKVAANPHQYYIPDPSGARDADGKPVFIVNPGYDPSMSTDYNRENERAGYWERNNGVIGGLYNAANVAGKTVGNVANKALGIASGVGDIYGSTKAYVGGPGKFLLPVQALTQGINTLSDVAHNKDYYWNLVTNQYQDLPDAYKRKKLVHQQGKGEYWRMPEKWFPGNGFLSNVGNAVTSPFRGYANSFANVPLQVYDAGRRWADPVQDQDNTFSDTGRWTTDKSQPHSLLPQYQIQPKTWSQTWNGGRVGQMGGFLPNSHNGPATPAQPPQQPQRPAGDFYNKVRQAQQPPKLPGPTAKYNNPGMTTTGMQKMSNTQSTPFLSRLVDSFGALDKKKFDLSAPDGFATSTPSALSRLVFGDYSSPYPRAGLLPQAINIGAWLPSMLTGIYRKSITPLAGAAIDKIRGTSDSFQKSRIDYMDPGRTPLGQKVLKLHGFAPGPSPREAPKPGDSAWRHALYDVTLPWKEHGMAFRDQARLATRPK